MFRLAHLSDIHLAPLPAIRRRELASKRITGYINWQRNRARHHRKDTTSRLVADMLSREPDYLAVTGDLINLGLDAEMEAARGWLESLGNPQDISVICGNHDAYVPGALAKALACWQPWVTDDTARRIDGAEDFPVLRRRDGVSIIACNSARATMPFLATGYFRAPQAAALARMLDEEGRKGRCRVVLIHHPPVSGATSFQRRLVGAGLFRKTVAKHGAELVLHGHTHLNTVAAIAGPSGPVPVVGVPSAGEEGSKRRPAARYNLFNIALGPNGWSIAMQEYGSTGATSPVGLISKRKLA